MFLCDKYAPKTIDDMTFNIDTMKHLFVMSKDVAIPHLILYGPSGSGKNTIARLLLEKIFDKSVNNVSDTIYTVTGSGNTQSDISIKQSPYHIVIDPNNNNFDKYLIQTIVKTYAKSMPFFNNIYKTSKSFKVVLINDIDNLSYYAQMSLRRTMEKYSSTCRFIMLCNAISKIIDPLKSRCVCVRIASPTSKQIIETVMKIAHNENIDISLQNLRKITCIAKNNIKHTIWLLECIMWNLNPSNTYVDIIDDIITLIMKKDIHGEIIIEIRKLLYKILITNISGTIIIQDIMVTLCNMKTISKESKSKIIDIASYFEHNNSIGRREIIHLDSFIIGVISILSSQNDIE
jgi:replication factor C subunit 3/5